MDASLFSRLQAQHVAAAQTVGTALLPKSGGRSGLVNATGLTPHSAATGGTTTGSTAGSSGATSSGAGTTADGATITSSDFLTLLVSELKNQDPTQPTDPNEYISQLVGVNSLEQLIQINGGITSLNSSVPATGTGTGSGSPTGSLVTAFPGTLAGVPLQHQKGTGETSRA